MKNLLSLVFAVVLGVACFVPPPASAYYYRGRCITHITTEAITTDITTEGNTTDTGITGTTIGSGPGLSASMGVQAIIAIGKWVIGAPR
jgi:hypothetical protein